MTTIPESELRLIVAGIAQADARALRRIAMTLHRWFEAECNGEIQRDDATGKPFHVWPSAPLAPRYEIPDREASAKKRLAKIMARYPGWHAYVQSDPRGAALYILRPGDVPPGTNPRECYTRGIAVYR